MPKIEEMPASIGVLELRQRSSDGCDGAAERRPVTSEVAGSSPVVPAIPFNHLRLLFRLGICLFRGTVK